MDRLKTLEDIDPEPCCHGLSKKDLKKEAKKHIENLKKISEKNEKRKTLVTPLIKWIKYFFELDGEPVYAFDKNDYLVEVNQ